MVQLDTQLLNLRHALESHCNLVQNLRVSVEERISFLHGVANSTDTHQDAAKQLSTGFYDAMVRVEEFADEVSKLRGMVLLRRKEIWGRIIHSAAGEGIE